MSYWVRLITILSAQHVLTYLILLTTYEVGTLSILILQMRRLRQNELRRSPKILQRVSGKVEIWAWRKIVRAWVFNFYLILTLIPISSQQFITQTSANETFLSESNFLCQNYQRPKGPPSST